MSFAKMKFFIAIILLAACAAVQGRSVQVHPIISMLDNRMDADTRIIDGHDAVKGLLPWHATLTLYFPNPSICGGSLISEKWVLTAAHCITGLLYVKVQLGGVDRSDMEYNQISKKFMHHKNFNSTTFENDVALIELPVPATLSANVQIIPLPARSHPDPAGSTVRLSGHGKDLGGEFPDILKWIDLTAITNTECSKYYPYVYPSTLCASATAHHNACQGDSGGPLVQYNLNAVQVGIVSFGKTWPACAFGFPVMYARVTSYLDWINQHTGIPIRD